MRICVLLKGPTCLSLRDALNSSSCRHLLQAGPLRNPNPPCPPHLRCAAGPRYG